MTRTISGAALVAGCGNVAGTTLTGSIRERLEKGSIRAER
jgi:hypothetical protein